MTAYWRYGVLVCNSFMVFGAYYFMEIPVGLENEIMNSYPSYSRPNNTSNQTYCTVCLGLGEVRYNLLFSVTRWASVAVCLPSGFVIDRLGNGRSAILFSILPLLGSVLFAVGAMSHAPVTTPMYILMLAGYSLLAFGDGSQRFVQARVISHWFPDATLTALAFGSFGYCGQGLSLFVTPYIATVAGLTPAVWLGPVACGFGVLNAAVLAYLLQLQTPEVAEDNQNHKTMVGNMTVQTLRELRALPGSYWMYIMNIGFSVVCWIVKQANLPDYLKLRHGYTMTEAGHITGIPPFVVLLSPLTCLVLKKVECDGIMSTSIQVWMLVFCVLLGFCPAVNIYVIVLADGIGIGVFTVLMWQVLVLLCPPSHVGTLAGLMYIVRNTITALTFIASGYILQGQNVTDTEEALRGYQHLFLMLVIMASTGLVFGAVMNILDIRKASALNSRIRRWQQSDMEAIGLMSIIQPSSKYRGIDVVNENKVDDDSPIKPTTYNDD